MTTIILRFLNLFSDFSYSFQRCTISTQLLPYKLRFLARMNVANSPAMGYNGSLWEYKQERMFGYG